jgi:hypothetical protein
MHKSNYTDLPRLKIVDITFGKFIIASITIIFAFILPVTYIEMNYFRDNTSQEASTGRVAGVNNINSNYDSILDSLGIELTNESTILIIIGILMITISSIIFIYLIVDDKYQRSRRYR